MADSGNTAAILVRPAEPGDLPALWPLLRENGKTDSEAGVLQRANALLGRDEHFLPVALINGVLVGYAWAQDYGPHLRAGWRTARLHDLFVAPAWRRAGAGAGLLTAVTAWAEAGGVRWLEWQASPAALPFYASLGLTGEPCPDPEHPFFEIEFPPL